MTLQDIILQLQNISGAQQNLGQIGGVSSIANIDANQIANAMRDMYDLTGADLPSSMFAGATIGKPMLQSTLQKT